MSKTRKRKMSKYAAKQFQPLPPHLSHPEPEPETKFTTEEGTQMVNKAPTPAETLSKDLEIDAATWNTQEDLDTARSHESEQRVRPGMVFWYNLESGTNKNAPPMKTTRGVTFQDCRILGQRPWVVLTEVDEAFHSVQIAPLTTGHYGQGTKTAVPCIVAGKSAVVLLSQSTPVNVNELVDYFTWMTPDTMRNIIIRWAEYLGIGEQTLSYYASKTEAMSKVESIITQVIDSKMADIQREKFSDQDIDGVLVRAMDTLQARCMEAMNKAVRGQPIPVVHTAYPNVPPEDDAELPAVAESLKKFYDRYPGMTQKKSPEPVQKPQKTVKAIETPTRATPDNPIRGTIIKGSRATPSTFINGILDKGIGSKGAPRTTILWTEDLAKLFLADLAALPKEKVAVRWELSAKGFSSLSKNLKKRFNL